MAIRFGPVAGAKPTNQECDGAPATSAVPVLPAISTSWPASDDAVPPVTTRRMARAMRSAAAGSRTARDGAGTGAGSRTQRPGSISPRAAIVAATRAIRNGEASTSAWP